ncbi:hypothetical protein DSM25559_4448 [Agrobacterium rosae]|uniref:Uncharacterized protein n=1 Tax=Agrobacterium rosae TaxID=1972867 RepID=A0A1R3U880_9HYPH|nr:hypothetical protein DSM25559_4448 [Agrobacterium rosae]
MRQNLSRRILPPNRLSKISAAARASTIMVEGFAVHVIRTLFVQEIAQNFEPFSSELIARSQSVPGSNPLKAKERAQLPVSFS